MEDERRATYRAGNRALSELHSAGISTGSTWKLSEPHPFGALRRLQYGDMID